MKFIIISDVIPLENGTHKRENWESPIMDKFNNAYEFLEKIEMKGHFEVFFESKPQLFRIEPEKCKGITKGKLNKLLNAISNL